MSEHRPSSPAALRRVALPPPAPKRPKERARPGGLGKLGPGKLPEKPLGEGRHQSRAHEPRRGAMNGKERAWSFWRNRRKNGRLREGPRNGGPVQHRGKPPQDSPGCQISRLVVFSPDQATRNPGLAYFQRRISSVARRMSWWKSTCRDDRHSRDRFLDLVKWKGSPKKKEKGSRPQPNH